MNSLAASAIIALLAAPAAYAADGFACTLGNASTSTFTVNSAVPFTGTMIGDTSATPPTRTKAGSFTIFPPFVSCGTFGPTQNDPLSISGSITASGGNTNIRPTGGFSIFIDPGAGTASVQNLHLDLLGGSAAAINAGLSNFRYPSFCTVDPSCALPFLIPISFNLSTLNITSVTLTQNAGVASGTLTPAMSGGYDFAIPVTATLTTAANFNGSPLDSTPQPVPIVFAGHIAVAPDGQSATVTSSFDLSAAPPIPGDPVSLPPTPFTTPPGSPLCAGLNLILTLTVSSPTLSIDATANLDAPGVRLRCKCDWNQTGAVTVQDLFDFLVNFFANDADFNGEGGTTVQDLFDFLGCFFELPPPC